MNFSLAAISPVKLPAFRPALKQLHLLTVQPPKTKNSAARKKGGRAVRVRDLHAFYGDVKAVKNVSVDFPAKQITAIIGPSGCGKSTLVRCINRMHEEITSARAEGRILLDELDINGPAVDPVAVRRTIGMVFQKPNPFPTMSIIDNVTAGLRLNGVKGSKLREKGKAALRDAGLWEEVKNRLNQPASGLSGGQQQRLCIARTIALEPEVILMDEPCSALDPRSTKRIEELTVELKKRFTVVLVTHNLQQATRIADRTAFMLDGEIIETGPTKQVFLTPKDVRTEEYVTGKFG